MFVTTNQFTIMKTITINQPITSKYAEIVAEVRANQSDGQSIQDAVNNAFQNNLYKFECDEDIAALASWFNGSFGQMAA